MCLKRTTKVYECMQKPYVENNHRYLGSLIREKTKNEKFHISESLQSPHTASMPKRHPKFGILATVYCRVNFTLENSHFCLIKHTIKTTLNTLNMIEMYSISDNSIFNK